MLNRQKLVKKKLKNGSFWRIIENLNLAVKQCYQTLAHSSPLLGQKLVENARISHLNGGAFLPFLARKFKYSKLEGIEILKMSINFAKNMYIVAISYLLQLLC